MSGVTGVSRRLQQCFERFQLSDYEGALVHLFPAVDKTAQRRQPNNRSAGSRITNFLRDEEIIISAIGTGSVMQGCTFGGLTFEDALYKFGRTSISHEGELDARLSFNDGGGLRIGQGQWNLPSSYIIGMAIAVVIAPENLGERTSDGLVVTILDKPFSINDVWGRPTVVRQHLCDVFGDSELFTRT